MAIVRNLRTFQRLEKIIKSGRYNKDEMLLDISDFLELGTLTQQEYFDLLALMEQNPPASRFNTTMDEAGNLVSDNTYLLLVKQITKQVYTAEVIEQMVTDFRMTGAVGRDQFGTLMTLIEEIYYPPVIEEPGVEEQPV